MFSQDDSAGAGSVNGELHYHDKVIVVNTERERESVLNWTLFVYLQIVTSQTLDLSDFSLFYMMASELASVFYVT